MIIVRIWEGLGNQLFQYAYARALKERTGYEVFLDINHPNRGDLDGEILDVQRGIKLDKFNISIDTLEWENHIGELSMLVDTGENLQCLDRLYTPEDGTYISASCISSLYFEDYWGIIKRELVLKEVPRISKELALIMSDFSTISVHMRLTDYLIIPDNICRQTYYELAFKYINKYVKNPFFLIFTDDEKMARERFHMPANSYWISDEGLANYEEMWLMSKCNHNIIAASTFSFWGALLNDKEDKIVIAPKKWAVRESYGDNWIII